MRKYVPSYSGTLRSHGLTLPHCISECSGIRIFGKRIKSIAFSTDAAIIKNINADAIIAVYPFTPQASISQAVINVADVPVFVGVGGGYTNGSRSVRLAMQAEHQGAYGVVVNAPMPNEVIAEIKSVVDIPVIATVAAGIDGESDVYNINSDTAAAKIAIALGAEKLILLTNTRGLMRDLHDDDTLIPEVKLGEIAALKEEGVISGGMIPKIECCEMCVKNGVKRAHIIDGRLLHSILIEMLSNEGIGTMIVE